MKTTEEEKQEAVPTKVVAPATRSTSPAPRVGDATSSYRREASRTAAEVVARLSGSTTVRRSPALVVGPANDPYERAADQAAAEVVARLSNEGGALRTPGLATDPLAGGPVVRRELDDRATSWKDIDAQANSKRLAHAADDYLFDKSLAASDDDAATADKIEQQKGLVKGQHDSDALPPAFHALYATDPRAAIDQFHPTPKQLATLSARDAGKVGKGKWGALSNFEAFAANEGDEERTKRDSARSLIAAPGGDSGLFSPQEIVAHLGAFKDGAHAFLPPNVSQAIEGEVVWDGFHGWGAIKKDLDGSIVAKDANFVAPLAQANAVNAKAHGEDGIETLENELGITGKGWSNSAANPNKEMIRWVIPKPKLDPDPATTGVLLKMATGREVGADPEAWVAGGFTKGGAHEATLDAIPRDDLVAKLANREIVQKVEKYPETGDDIPKGAKGAVVGKKPAPAG